MIKLPQFKNTQEISKYLKDLNIKVDVSDSQGFGQSQENYISMNYCLSLTSKTYCIVHELAHIVTKTTTKNDTGWDTEDADRIAVEALFMMDKDENNSFNFAELLQYSYFARIKPLLSEEQMTKKKRKKRKWWAIKK